MTIEYRFAPIGADADTHAISGQLIKWQTPSYIRELGCREQFERGAFGDVNDMQDVTVNIMHDATRRIAAIGDGLSLTENEIGMRADIELPISHADVISRVRNGQYKGLSLEFRPIRDSMAGDLRRIHTAQLIGLGIVESPAHADSLIDTRAQSRARHWSIYI